MDAITRRLQFEARTASKSGAKAPAPGVRRSPRGKQAAHAAEAAANAHKREQVRAGSRAAAARQLGLAATGAAGANDHPRINNTGAVLVRVCIYSSCFNEFAYHLNGCMFKDMQYSSLMR